MKIYIKTKSGIEFGPGEMCGDVTNKDGIGIVDPSSFMMQKILLLEIPILSV